MYTETYTHIINIGYAHTFIHTDTHVRIHIIILHISIKELYVNILYSALLKYIKCTADTQTYTVYMYTLCLHACCHESETPTHVRRVHLFQSHIYSIYKH